MSVSLHARATQPGPASFDDIFEACFIRISELEDVINKSRIVRNFNESTVMDVKQMAWLRNRGEIERIKDRLRDSMRALQLSISSLNL